MSFDDKAREWDNDPKKTERAALFAREIEKHIDSGFAGKGLEFGCGTGLLSFQLKDKFNSITLVDSSAGMIEVLKEKIQSNNISNFYPLFLESLDDKALTDKFDAIFTLMVLHHIIDIDSMLAQFNARLVKGGILCIGDLVKEDGSFHSHEAGFDGHNGFDKDELAEKLSKAGFEIVNHTIFYEIVKQTDSSGKKYPLFSLIARKIT